MLKRSHSTHSGESALPHSPLPSSKRIRHCEYKANFPEILTSEHQTSIYQKISSELTTLDEKICVICSALSTNWQLFSVENLKNTTLFQAMQERLSIYCDLPVQITNYYDISHFHDMFKGMLLSKRGIYGPDIAICNQCQVSLRKKTRVPPKFAIANGFWMCEEALELSNLHLNPTELSLVSLSQTTHSISTIRSQKILRSHVYYFMSKPDVPAAILPRSLLNSSTFEAVIVGSCTPFHKAQIMKRYQVRRDRIFETLHFFRSFNPLYEQVQINQCVVNNEQDAIFSTIDLPVELDVESHNGNINITPDYPGESLYVAILQDHSQSNVPSPDLMNIPVENTCQSVGVWRSSLLMSSEKTNFWKYAFPELFPYGRGGADEIRQVHISMETFLLHLLHIPKFSAHHSFTLVAFDAISRMKSRQACYVHTFLNPTIVQMNATVTRNELEDQLRYQENRLNSIRRGLPLPEQPRTSSPLFHLQNAISVGLKEYMGSNAQRKEGRTKAFSYLTTFGLPTVFFTFTPSSFQSIQALQYTGTFQLNQGAFSNYFPPAVVRQYMLASDGFAAARYFKRLTSIVIRNIIGWNPEESNSRGIFGIPKAFYGSVEEQGSTNLHVHFMIWLEGWPSSLSEWEQLEKETAWKQYAVQYQDSILRANLPLDSELQMQCPECAANLTIVKLTTTAYQRHRRDGNPPVCATCQRCNRQYASHELLSTLIQKLSSFLSEAELQQLRPENIDFTICSKMPLPYLSNSIDLPTFQLCIILLLVQNHAWHHVKSCFKKGRTYCRFFIPYELSNETTLTKLKRFVGSEYLNPYSLIVSLCFKCNHDIKIYFGLDGIQKVYYTVKYTTKEQKSLENTAAVYLHAFDKHFQKYTESGSTTNLGRSRLMSMLSSLSEPHEVGAPMAGFLLIQHEPFFGVIPLLMFI
jgi:hypothetical protein